MGTHTHSQAYSCYLDGMTIEECCKEINKCYKTVKAYYTNFTIASMKIKSNDVTNKLMQIREIEDVLFTYYAKPKKDDCDWKKIADLELSYVRFNALK